MVKLPKSKIQMRNLLFIKTKNHRLLGDFFCCIVEGDYSHSIVAGGLVVMSYTTRLTPLTSLTILEDAARSTS